MIYLQLYWSFLKIGFTSFGGLSMVPLILEEMTSHGWMTAQDLSNLVAIAEMTPGPLGVNCATFTGTQTAGFAGGLVAVLGVLTPSLSLGVLAAAFFEKCKESTLMKTILEFVKPVCIAILCGVIVKLGRETYFQDNTVLYWSFLISALMLYLRMKRKWSVPQVILCSAVLGLLFYGVL